MFNALSQWWRKRGMRKGVAMLRSRTVGELMTRYIITASQDDSIIKAATKMIAEDISCLVIMDGEKLLGILSERDFLRKVPLNKDVFKMTVKDIMTPNVVTVPPTMTLPEAVNLMKAKNFRRLVVADGAKTLGVITQTDFSRAARDAFHAYPGSQEFAVDAIMSKSVLTATPKDTFTQARERMKKLNLGSILIVDRPKPPQTVEGIFTEYDVVMQFYDQKGKLDLKDISSFMRKHVRAVQAGTSVIEANRLMLEKKIRRLPVVDGDRVAGVITQTDVVRFIYPMLEKLLASTNDSKVIFKPCRRQEFHGEVKGEHLKVYSTP